MKFYLTKPDLILEIGIISRLQFYIKLESLIVYEMLKITLVFLTYFCLIICFL